MATTTTPTWSAAKNGTANQSRSIKSAGVNQFLGTHGATVLYSGDAVVLSGGAGGVAWYYHLDAEDVDQPFTMSGTTIGRVAIPVLAVNGGADLLVSLCSDNGSGQPGAVITQTRIPASWISQLGVVSGVSTSSETPPATVYSNSPLGLPQFNNYHKGLNSVINWPYPAVGSVAAPTATYYGGYMIQIGGVVSGSPSDVAINNVYAIPCSANGVMSPAIPQPSFPINTDGSGKCCVAVEPATGNVNIVQIGGSSTFGGAATATVYTSIMTTSTGSLSAWSTQTSLPYNIQNQGMCSNNGYVYVIGGLNLGVVTNQVSYAQIQNGQITNWLSAPPLPVSVMLPYVGVSDNFIIVSGGVNAGFNVVSTNTYYAPIAENGSVGQWILVEPAPSTSYVLDYANISGNPANYGFITQTQGLQSLSFGSSGPGFWLNTVGNGAGQFTCYVDLGDGSVMYYGLESTYYNNFTFSLAPYISVPMPTTGLTNGATYHILMQQPGSSISSYLCLCDDAKMFPGNPTALTSPKNAYTWTATTLAHGVPFQIYDQTAGGTPLHTWEDGGARITTLAYATTPDQRFLGICDATVTQAGLNSNQGFENGLTPWVATGGTAVQSSTQVYQAGFSAQVTPSGSASTVYVQSENLQCLPGQSVTVSGWVWFTTAVTTNASMSINWYTSTGTYISTSSNNVSVPATTWTNLTNTFTAPATAYEFTINPALSGTPAASNVFYVDEVTGYPTIVNKQESSVVVVDWNGNWPTNPLVPLGAEELA